jgi:DNA-binding NtrC family response regulator
MTVSRQKSILIVDADTRAAHNEGEFLASCGYSIMLAASGEEAVGTFEAADTIDLVLIDPYLGPGMGGVDAARIIQEIRHVPVVLVSSGGDEASLAGMGLVDAYGFVQKRSSDVALLASVAIAFRRQDAERRAKEDCLRKILDAIPDIISINDPKAFYTL